MVNHGQLFWRMKNDIDSCMMSDGEGSWQRTIGANHDWLCWRIVINCQSQPGLARGFGPRVCWGWPFLFLASSSHLYPPPFSPSVLQLGVFALWSARQRQMKRNCLGLSGLIFCCAGVPVSMCVCVHACAVLTVHHKDFRQKIKLQKGRIELKIQSKHITFPSFSE